MPNLVEIGQVILEKKIFKFRKYIFANSNYLPLEKGVALHLDKLESPSPKDALCQVLMKYGTFEIHRNDLVRLTFIR